MNRTALIFSTAIGLVVIALAFGVKDLASSQNPSSYGNPVDPHSPRPFTEPQQPTPQPNEPIRPKPVSQAECDPNAQASVTSAVRFGQVKASLSHSKIVQQGAEDLFMALEIKTEEMALDDRPPLNLALVIDRSGSMRGGPMSQARQAAKGLVERLSPMDRVSIITYDTDAEVVVPSTQVDRQGKARLLAAIENIHARGMTNIHGGLVLGYEELTRGISGGAISRMVHLSDGQANVGVTDTPSLVRLASEAAARGIRSTSVGLGVHYNEHLMEALAEAGRGQYYYVRDGARLDSVFAGELRNIQGTVATNVELRLRPCSGFRVEEVYGLSSRREGAALVVNMADLAGGENRRIIARLSTSGASRGAAPVINATLVYEDIESRSGHHLPLALGATVVSDARLADSSVDRDVMAQAIEVQSAMALRKATDSFNRGQRQEAARLLQSQRAVLDGQAKRYRVSDAPAARRSRSLMDNFRGAFGASAEALSGEEARDVALEAQVKARSMERQRKD